MRFFIAVFGLISTLGGASLPQGASLLPREGLAAFTASVDAKRGKASVVIAEGKEALHLEVTAPDNANPWDVQASARNAAAIEKGDRLLASFWMRGLQSRAESGEAESEFDVELAREPWGKSISYPLRAGKDWRLIQIPFESADSYAIGEAQMIFRMGYLPEAFEISGLSVVNYGKSVSLESLPKTKVSYPGREAGAAWRKAALDRIQRIRTAPLKVAVTDKAGQPVKGARISVTMLHNAFHFGSATSGHYVFKDSNAEGRKRYEDAVKANFNIATEENALKWGALGGDWGPEWNLDLAVNSANWVKSLGLEFRAHCLIWPSWRNMPKGAAMLKGDPKALHQAVFDRISSMAAAMKGVPLQWDVMNEPFDNHDLMDIFGEGVMADFFEAAHRADPRAELFINDYAILAGGGGDSPHRRHYEKTIQYLIDKKAPLDGIGMQGHFGWSLTSPDDARAILDRYARFGKKIMVTEYDIDIDDLDLAGDYTRDLLILLYSHPAVAGFVMWGFWDGAHWHANAPLFKKDWSPKPAYQAWQDLVLGEWRTQSSGQTAADGAYATRGHLGDYEVKISVNGKTLSRRAKLGKDGLELKVILE